MANIKKKEKSDLLFRSRRARNDRKANLLGAALRGAKRLHDARVHEWQYLSKFALAPGYSDEYVNVFLARNLEKVEQPPAQDEDEDIEVIEITPENLEQAIYAGESINGEAIASYFLARPY